MSVRNGRKFNFKTPIGLPSICSLISGYFSYDTIRYFENIPNNCKDDLNFPDVRLLRPRELIIHDNLKRKIFYIVNVYKDEKINNYKQHYLNTKHKLDLLETISLVNCNEEISHNSLSQVVDSLVIDN